MCLGIKAPAYELDTSTCHSAHEQVRQRIIYHSLQNSECDACLDLMKSVQTVSRHCLTMEPEGLAFDRLRLEPIPSSGVPEVSLSLAAWERLPVSAGNGTGDWLGRGEDEKDMAARGGS